MNHITLLSALTLSLPVMLDSAAKGTALLVLIALLVLCMRKTSAATRHLAWLMGIFGLILLPLLSAALPRWSVLPAWASVPIPANDRIEGTSVQSTPLVEPQPQLASRDSHRNTQFPAAPFEIEKPIATASTDLPPVPSVTPRANTGQWLAIVWAVGVIVLLLRTTGSAILLRRSARHASLVTSGSLRQALDAAGRELNLRRRVHLLVDERRIIPLVWGIFRARMVLPGEAYGWDDSRLRAVLLHELAHIKRGDLPVMLVTHFACALHWFNPLVWLAAWRMHIERERACDDLVLTAGVKASDYAEHLLHVATKLHTASPAGALAMARPSRLEGRLLAVLNQQLPRGDVPRSIGLLTLAVSLGIVIPMAMLRAQEKDATPLDPHQVESSKAPIGPAAEPPASPDTPASSEAIDPTAPKKAPVLGDIPIVDRLFQVGSEKAVLVIKEDGTILLNGTPVSHEELTEKLRALAKVNPDQPIALRAEQRVPYQNVVRVLDASRAAGLQNVSFEVGGSPDQQIDRLAKELEALRKGGTDLAGEPKQYEDRLKKLEAAIQDLKASSSNGGTAAKEKLDQARREAPQLNQFQGQQSLHSQSARQAILQARAQEAGLIASGLGEDHPRVKALRGQIAAYEKSIAVGQSAKEKDRAQEITRLQLDHAEHELKRLSELEKQKLVSQAELDRAKSEVEIRKAELTGDSAAVARVRLDQANRELQRLNELHKAKMVSGEELDRAKFEVELRKAEMAGDQSAAARAKVQNAESQLKRVAELRAQNAISASEYDARQLELQIAKAELQQVASNDRKESTASSSTEILQLLDDDLRLAEEKLAILKREQAAGFATVVPVIRMQAELVALRRAKAAHEGKQAEVQQLFDDQMKLLEELHRAVSSSESDADRYKKAIDIQREILALKREKAGATSRAARQ